MHGMSNRRLTEVKFLMKLSKLFQSCVHSTIQKITKAWTTAPSCTKPGELLWTSAGTTSSREPQGTWTISQVPLSLILEVKDLETRSVL